MKVIGHGSTHVRTVQIYARGYGYAGTPIRVTVARSRHRTFERTVTYRSRQIRFALRRGERVRVTARYVEDWSRTEFRNVGERVVAETPITEELIRLLQGLGFDTSGLVVGEVLRSTVPILEPFPVAERCERTLVARGRR